MISRSRIPSWNFGRIRFAALSSLAILVAGFAAATTHAAQAPPPDTQKFSVSFPKERSAQPLDGRLLLILSNDPSEEPRMQISLAPRTQMIFGIDIDGMQPGQPATIDDSSFGYPVRYLHDVKPGEYYMQVVLNRYETFHRADGRTVKLHMDQGEGQHWNVSPTNLYSKPVKITIGANASATPIAVSLDQEIPAIPAPKDTKYIRHMRI